MKERCEPLELKIYKCLSTRMDLDPIDTNHFNNLVKGYHGEKMFDDWLKASMSGGLVLNDLLHETNNSIFQIDSLFLTAQKIYLFEVKNYEGDFFIEGEKWYSASKLEIKNPILQLKRNESLFRRLLQEMKFSLPVEAYVVFLNPEFHLYQAPPTLPIVYPFQLNRFGEKLKINNLTSKGVHSKLAEKLLSLHVDESPYSRLPEYRYEEVAKGIVCARCGRLNPSLLKNTVLFCSHCSVKESYKDAVLRSLKEFKLLFPERKITTDQIDEWCGKMKNKRSIQRILSENFVRVGFGKSSCYVDSK
ncbi:nuclease-related domain-containing protein [Bacillus sp. UMB0893]|uniref:nuclease-related domain-containing protein n=1 Tax=Bacillus sp. UMB0893 TaxID=2066053 RepID=UPI002153822B|nr:nuclease-related domain-containing protein [Bacillus sp. UMB0893]